MRIIYDNLPIPNSIEKSVYIKTKDSEKFNYIAGLLKESGYSGTVFTDVTSSDDVPVKNNDVPVKNNDVPVKNNDVEFEKIADIVIDAEDIIDLNISEVMNSPEISRKGGEVYVPAYVWQTAQFQSWYKDLLESGNTLEKADVLYCFTTSRGFLFSYVMKVSIWVEAEKRFKANEIIISRRNVSNVIAYTDDKIVLIKEFRSPVSNDEGFVYELPGGSSFDDAVDPLENARTEFFEEVGFLIKDKERFRHVSDRQLAATVITHKSNLYAIKLTEDEIKEIEMIGKKKDDNTTVIGDNDEHTYTVIVDKKELFSLPVDFSTIGMIYSAIV
jgi:hypothetical protein